MCLAAFAINASARWPLVIASNRDEFFDRPTLPLARWQNGAGHTLISGRDMRAGGTWLGMTPGGRMALLTNVRELEAPLRARSRGELVMRWLDGRMDAGQLMVQTDSAAYGGFNLVLGDLQTGAWTWVSNRPASSGLHSQVMGAGIYGLSNAALDSPWPKTLALKTAMQEALTSESEAPLWAALANRSRAGTGQLPATGLPLGLETALSSAYVDSPERGYGTRCSTLLVARMAAHKSGQPCWSISMTEKTHRQSVSASPAPDDAQEVRLAFQWHKHAD